MIIINVGLESRCSGFVAVVWPGCHVMWKVCPKIYLMIKRTRELSLWKSPFKASRNHSHSYGSLMRIWLTICSLSGPVQLRRLLYSGICSVRDSINGWKKISAEILKSSSPPPVENSRELLHPRLLDISRWKTVNDGDSVYQIALSNPVICAGRGYDCLCGVDTALSDNGPAGWSETSALKPEHFVARSPGWRSMARSNIACYCKYTESEANFFCI